MKNVFKVGLSGIAFAFLSQTSIFAANVEFTANVSNSCTISNISNGILVQNAAGTSLSSLIGTSGSVDVTATSEAFNVYVDAPTAWNTSPALTPATTFLASRSVYTPRVGTLPVTIDLVANANVGTFPTGTNYAATVVVRCE
jgi:hypothetical protein